jgi:chromosome partitioning protein
MPARTYIVLNRKGGVGKTSLCFHLAGTFAKGGRRVLLIDTDSQCNLTEGLLGTQAEGLPPSRTVAALFGDEPVEDRKALVVATAIAGIHILPGSEAMEHINIADPADDPRQAVLRDFVEEVRDDFDIVLVDCPPSILLGSWAALVAGDGVVVPLQVEDFGAQGLKKLNRALHRVRREVNPGLMLLGYVINMCNQKLAIHAQYTEKLRAAFGTSVFAAEIPMATDYKVAVTASQPIAFYKPRSVAAKAIAALAEELVARDAAATSRKDVA